jgi:hypothetical protein
MITVDLADPPTIEERIQVDAIRAACRHDGAHVDPWGLLALIRIESDLGVPDHARGLLGAVWCVEAGLRTRSRSGGPVRGDYRDGVAMAHGPLQLWPGTISSCRGRNGAADSLEWSARCWVARIEATLPKAARRCPDADPWGVAEAAIANVRKYQWRCDARSEHWRLMDRARAMMEGN